MILQLKQVPKRPPTSTGPEFGTLPYDQSGWCNFEQGAATLVVGHMSAFKRTAKIFEVMGEAMREGFMQMLGYVIFVFLLFW